jgi:hypothetical protein
MRIPKTPNSHLEHGNCNGNMATQNAAQLTHEVTVLQQVQETVWDYSGFTSSALKCSRNYNGLSTMQAACYKQATY